MIQSIELENFKAFGERIRAEFAPITLLYGENSAGKSSVLHAISLLKQTRESREPGAVLLPRAEHGIIDLGSFQELLFDHDQDRSLCIRVNLTSERRAMRLSGLSGLETSEIGIELSFARPQYESETHVLSIEIILPNGEVLARFEPDEETRLRDFVPLFSSHLRTGVRPVAASCTELASDLEIWRQSFLQAHEFAATFVESLEFELASLDRRSRQASLFDDEDSEDTVEVEQERLMETISFYKHSFNLDAFVERMNRIQRGQKIGLDGFVPAFTPRLATSTPPELRALRAIRRLRNPDIIDVSRLAIMVGRTLERTLTQWFPLGPFRIPPTRWYIFSGSKPSDVGYTGESLPDLLYRNPGLVRRTNEWLRRLEIGHQLVVESVGARLKDLFEVRLTDDHRGPETSVSLQDVGFGISQILPFVVQSLSDQEQIVAIEQPEVHVHPRLQADVADLIAEASKSPTPKQFVIETHSEHLVLRFQRLIRAGQLEPEDVSVLYVSRSESGSRVMRLRLDEKGRFIDEWPGGFFPERMRELR